GSSESLLARTLARLDGVCPPQRVRIATGAHLLAATREALPHLPPEAFLAEPAARNTAPCIAWATNEIARTDPEAVVVVLPSDHHVADEPAFRACLATEIESAASGTITTIGIEPT